MTNKYPQRRDDGEVLPPPDMFAGQRTTPKKFVRWKCRKCKKEGAAPELHDGLAPVVARIREGHQRSIACHRDHDMRDVYVEYQSKTLDFATFAKVAFPPRATTAPREFSPL